MYASQILTAASASCFFLAMFEAVLSRCFSRSLLNSKISEAIKQPPKVTITRLTWLPRITRVLKQELSANFVLLFLLRSHVGLNNEPLDGEVENQRSHCSVKYGARQELVGEVNREQIRLAGSVQPAKKVSFLFVACFKDNCAQTKSLCVEWSLFSSVALTD